MSSLLFALTGVFFAFGGGGVLLIPYNKMLSEIFWNTTEFRPILDPFQMFILSPLGGTIAYTYILLAFIAYYQIKEKNGHELQLLLHF